jgi:threonylcarbamoyladenosine tRNA methylthiotransferase MtaB
MGARVVRNDAKGLIESYRIEKQNGASTSSARTDLANGSTPQPFALSLSKGCSFSSTPQEERCFDKLSTNGFG